MILATEIIVVFAKWYPFDENKESTRFADYYQKLSSFGVTFPKDKTYNFFKK